MKIILVFNYYSNLIIILLLFFNPFSFKVLNISNSILLSFSYLYAIILSFFIKVAVSHNFFITSEKNSFGEDIII